MVVPTRMELSRRHIRKSIKDLDKNSYDDKSEYENLKWDFEHYQLPPLKMTRYKELKKKFDSNKIGRNIVLIDYKTLVHKLINNVFEFEGRKYQYSIEQRRDCLHVVELNFKPNTQTTMSIPLPVYNNFVEWLNQNITNQGMRGNDAMGEFVKIYEKYRRDFLGATIRLKPSSYARYASVLFGFWKVVGNVTGFQCSINPQKITKTVTQEDNKTIIESEILSKGYFIKPVGNMLIKIADKSQKGLLEFQER